MSILSLWPLFCKPISWCVLWLKTKSWRTANHRRNFLSPDGATDEDDDGTRRCWLLDGIRYPRQASLRTIGCYVELSVPLSLSLSFFLFVCMCLSLSVCVSVCLFPGGIWLQHVPGLEGLTEEEGREWVPLILAIGGRGNWRVRRSGVYNPLLLPWFIRCLGLWCTMEGTRRSEWQRVTEAWRGRRKDTDAGRQTNTRTSGKCVCRVKVNNHQFRMALYNYRQLFVHLHISCETDGVCRLLRIELRKRRRKRRKKSGGCRGRQDIF